MTDAFEARDLVAPEADLATTSPLTTAADPVPAEVQPSAAPAQPQNEAFAALGLAAELLQAVADLGFTAPTAVQQASIPRAMAGLEGQAPFTDLMVSSQTGSGKTAAFLLPVLHTLLAQQREQQAQERAEAERLTAEALARGEVPAKKPKRRDPTNPRHFKAAAPGALILCPTRELAQQVCADAIDLVRHCKGLRIANVVGGIPYQLQIAKLQNANLVVATPGRLLDLQRSMQIKLDQVRFLVVDEADRMLDLGFADDLAEIHELTNGRQQTMMFSATFAPRIMQLASRVMREPQRIQIDSPQDKHTSIKQVMHWADNLEHKRKLLDHWLRDTSVDQAVVFASTQVECDGLANDLVQDGFHAVALHGALSQGLRNRRLTAFRDARVQILVATDVAARGLDVPTITHVINFGLPMKAEDYVHRIGRTGRAGRSGQAVTIAEFRDRRRIADIEQYTQQRLQAEAIPGLEPQQRFPAFEQRPQRGNARGGRFGDRGPRGQGSGWGQDRAPRGGFGGGQGGGFDGGQGAPREGFAPRPRRDDGAPFQKQGFGDRGQDPRQSAPRPHGDRQGAERGFGERSFGDRSFGDRKFEGRPPRRDDGFAARGPAGFPGKGAPPRPGRDFDPRFDARSEGFAPRPDFAKPAGVKSFARDGARKPGKFVR